MEPIKGGTLASFSEDIEQIYKNYDSSKSIAAKVLWATISGGHQSWTHTGTTAKAEDHNVNKSRTIRCIKTSPAFIIEE